MNKLVFALLFSAQLAAAQIYVPTEPVRVTETPAIAGRPELSADGSFVLASTGTDICKVDLATLTAACVAEVSDAYDLALSPDGQTAAYSYPEFDGNLRYISVETVNLADMSRRRVVSKSRELSSGKSLSNNATRLVDDMRVATAKIANRVNDTRERPVASIYHGHLLVDGHILDPQGKGSYLWPAVSPDGKRLVYWLVGHGCYVCDIDGSNAMHLGAFRAPVWADNDVVIGMRDRDNGVEITSSCLAAHRLSSGDTQILTPDTVIALYPAACADRVVFVDPQGHLYYLNLLSE